MYGKPNKFSRHYHLGIQGTPSVTCWVEECPSDGSLPNVSHVSFAICSPSDMFSRKKGTFIAQNRMEAGKFVVVDRFEGANGPLINEIMDSILIEEEVCGIDETTKRVYEVLDYYYLSKEPMDFMESKAEESHGFYFGKVLPFLSKFRIFQRIFYGI